MTKLDMSLLSFLCHAVCQRLITHWLQVQPNKPQNSYDSYCYKYIIVHRFIQFIIHSSSFNNQPLPKICWTTVHSVFQSTPTKWWNTLSQTLEHWNILESRILDSCPYSLILILNSRQKPWDWKMCWDLTNTTQIRYFMSKIGPWPLKHRYIVPLL